MTTITQNEKNELKNLREELDYMKSKKKEYTRRFYASKFKYYEGMTDEEKIIVKKNIDRRNELARIRYKNNEIQRVKQIDRVKARRLFMKAQNNIEDITT